MTGDVDRPRVVEFFAGQTDVRFAYLFGSQARGEAGPLSDVDLAVALGGDPAGHAARRDDLNARLMQPLGRNVLIWCWPTVPPRCCATASPPAFACSRANPWTRRAWPLRRFGTTRTRARWGRRAMPPRSAVPATGNSPSLPGIGGWTWMSRIDAEAVREHLVALAPMRSWSVADVAADTVRLWARPTGCKWRPRT